MIITTYKAIGVAVIRCERNGMSVEQTIARAASASDATYIALALNASQELREHYARANEAHVS